MAKKTPEKKKSSRNALIIVEAKTKGRAPNKTVEKKAKSKPLGTRLHCVLVTPKSPRKEARFECFGNKNDAMAAALGMNAPMPVPTPRAFSPSNLALMEKEMKGLRGRRGPLPARGLRGTPEEHRTRAGVYMQDLERILQTGVDDNVDPRAQKARGQIMAELAWLDPAQRAALRDEVYRMRLRYQAERPAWKARHQRWLESDPEDDEDDED